MSISDRTRVITSLLLEHACPGFVTDHVHLPAVPGVIAWTVAALDTGGRPPSGALTC